MDKNISGLFRRPGLKHLPKRIATLAIASGFVFSGAADYARLSNYNDPHQMTENTEVIIEQINQSQPLTQAKVLNQALEIKMLDNVSNDKTINNRISNDTEKEKQTYHLVEKQTKFLESFVKHLQEVIESLDLVNAIDLDDSSSQKSTQEPITEKIIAENKNTSVNKNTSANKKKPAENKETAKTTDAPEPTRPDEPTSRPQVVEETTALESYPLSIPTISQKTIPQGIEFDKNGIPLNYSRVIEGKASAYSQDPITATGTKPVPGTVAVNPRNIPYGTKLWIVSTDGRFTYGYAVAEDTGGFVHWNNGPIVDLYMNTSSECYNFGVRNVRIYVLD